MLFWSARETWHGQCSEGHGTGKPERYFEGFPFLFFSPEGTPVPDTEEIQDSKKSYINKPIREISVSLGFQESLFQVLLSLGESF